MKNLKQKPVKYLELESKITRLTRELKQVQDALKNSEEYSRGLELDLEHALEQLLLLNKAA